MERFKETIIMRKPKPGEDKADFCQVWDEGSDDDQSDVLSRGFPRDPPNQGVCHPIRHVSSSVQNEDLSGLNR